ncbi:MAG: chloride channel protein [Coriobacteriaceae bacterium]|nr:chloride channel protein [Coriobacteriaceae bacterium]
MGRRQKRGLSKAHDERPYINESGRLFSGPADAVAVTGGMTVLALAFGFAVGFLVFLVMNLSTWLTSLLWNGYLDGTLDVGMFPLIVCTAGGLVIGLWTYFTDDKIEPLEEVMAEFKRTGTYEISPVKGTVSFLLPLVFGGSIGFEAGLTGIITAACCWIRDRLKAAGLRVAAVADVTIAASLSAIFGTPLAGIVAGAESSPDDGSGDVLEEPNVDDYNMRKPAKIVLYTSAAFGAFAGIKVFSGIFGASAGFPRFDAVTADGLHLLWVLAAIAVAYAMTLIYHGTQRFARGVARRTGDSVLGTIGRPLAAGVILGLIATMLPYVMFPGEVQSHMLMETWSTWTALALIATGLLKAFATPLCINWGWVGGNFCPSIFAGAACGYGLSMITGADPALMVTVIITAFLAGVVRKPVLTIAILLLCFPLESIIWCGLAAIIGAALPVPSFLLGEPQEA